MSLNPKYIIPPLTAEEHTLTRNVFENELAREHAMITRAERGEFKTNPVTIGAHKQRVNLLQMLLDKISHPQIKQ